MNMIGERIAAIRGKRTKEQFATDLGIHRNTIHRYETGHSLPDAENLARILTAHPDIDARWLITGDKSSWAETTVGSNVELSPEERQLKQEVFQVVKNFGGLESTAERIGCSPDDLVRLLHRPGVSCIADYRALTELEGDTGGRYVRLRSINPIAASTSPPVALFRREWLLDVGSSVDNLLTYEVRDDAMFPTFSRGDSVVINTGELTVEDGLFVVRLNNIVTLKRLQAVPTGIHLLSDNSRFPVIPLSAEDLDVVGRAVAVVKKL